MCTQEEQAQSLRIFRENISVVLVCSNEEVERDEGEYELD